MIVHLATDHAGFELKTAVKQALVKANYEVVDHGADALDPEDDFPDYISLAAGMVSQNPESERAIIFGGSGQGEAMLANRFPRVRAAVYYGGPSDIIRLSREHNDANTLSIGARFVSVEEALAAIELWLVSVPLNDEKYQRRIRKIQQLTDAMY